MGTYISDMGVLLARAIDYVSAGQQIVDLPPCSPASVSAKWVCREILRRSSGRGQQLLFHLHSAIVNSARYLPAAVPQVPRVRFDPLVECYSICHVLGDIALRFLREP